MAGNIKGITIEIGGDTQKLNKALEGVNKQSRDIQGELRQVDRLLKLDPKNTNLLAQRQKLLAEAVSNSKTKLETLKEAERQVQQQFKEGKVGEEQYRLIQREVIATEQNLESLEASLKKTNRDWEAMGKSLQDAGGKMKDIGGKMSVGVTAPIVAAGAAGFKFAADLEDAMGASDQIFKGASGSIKAWADNLDSYYGIAEGEALTYANTMGAMLQNIGGLSEAEASKQSQTLVELAGDLTAMFGGTTESAVQALTGALKGNTSMLDNYGMGVNDATIKAKALEMGLYDGTGAMDLQTKQAATLALIMEQTADAQGQAARESEGASGTMRAFQTELKNIATEIGEVLLPIITPFITKAKEMAQRFGELSPEAQKVIIVIAGIAAAIGPLLMVIGSIVSGAGALIGVFGALSGPIGIVIAAIVALVAAGVLLYKNWDTIIAKVGELWATIKTEFEEMKTNIVTKLSEWWTSLSTWYDTTKTNIVTKLGDWWTAMSTWYDDTKANVVNKLAEWWTSLSKWYDDTKANVVNKLADWWTEIKTWYEDTRTNIVAKLGEWWTSLSKWYDDTKTNIVTKLSEWWTSIGTWYDDTRANIVGKLAEWWTSLSKWYDDTKTNIVTKLSEWWTEIKTWYDDTRVNIVGKLAEWWESMGKWYDDTKESAKLKWDELKEAVVIKIEELETAAMEKFRGIARKIADIWDGIKTNIVETINSVIGTINGFIGHVNNIKINVPTISIPLVGTFGGYSIGMPQIPEIPMLAKGGLVTKEMLAMVGDGGPEAVIPLNELKKMVAEIASSAAGEGKRSEGIVQHITVQSPTALSPSETARQIKNASRRLALEW